ncbi:MAG: GIY-YIG nuclease family protein [bacterium]
MFFSKKFINRKIASSLEKALHEIYSNKRIRVEWFHLDQKEVSEITNTFND